MSKIKKNGSRLFRILKILLVLAGIFFMLIVFLAFTSWPYMARYRLATCDQPNYAEAKTLIVMGAGGFPSENLLMRLWYTVETAEKHPTLSIVLTTPGDSTSEESTIVKMRNFLIKDGVEPTRILLETKGLNTRHQALMVAEMYQAGKFGEPIVVLSSPEHVYRSILCFRKVGFQQVSGQPTLEAMLETNLSLESDKLGGKKGIPDVGRSISLRYSFWDYLKYEVEVAREYLAIAYYWLRGWI